MLKRLFKIELTLIIFIIIGLLSSKFLNSMDLRYRSWTHIIAVIVLLSAIIIGLLCIVLKIYQVNKWAGAISSIGGIAAGLFSIYFIFISFVFSFSSEHVVEKKGQKYVAVVDAFLQVYVDYHKYVNGIVMGKDSLFTEDYGNGGYDPFERDPMPKPKKTTSYVSGENSG